MTDTILGLRFTADQRELQQAADKGQDALRKIGDEAKRTNEQSARAAQQYTEALKRQADTLGMTRSQTMAYEASQQKLTEAQRQSVTASISAIDAYDRKQAMLGRVSTMAAGAGAAVGVALVAGLKASVTAAAQAEQSQLRLEAVLKGTRYAAGLTADELDGMAKDMQDRLGINDEAVKDSMAVMLTFRQVGRESFGEAMEVAANLAAVMQTDLKSAVMQLGKALEDPERGLTALTRAGVSFGPAQKAMIIDMVETGRQAEAITLILRAMKEQGLDGVAAAMNTGVAGAGRNLKNSWDDLLETIGKSDVIMTPVIGIVDGITKSVKTLDQALNGGVGDALLSFATFGLYTPDPKRAAPAAQTNAWENDDRDAGLAGRRVEAAREKADEFLKQFRTDNERLEEQVMRWRKLAAVSQKTAEEIADGEARIRASVAKKGSASADSQRRAAEREQRELERRAAEEVKAANRGYVESAELKVKQWDREGETLGQLNEAMSAQRQALQLEIGLMGVSDAQREKTIALKQLEIKFDREATGLSVEKYEEARRLYLLERDRIAGLLDERGAARERKKELEERANEQKRFNDELARGLTDSIFRGFEGGKSVAKNFWDAMKNMAKTTILQPIVKFMVSPITGAVGGVLGGFGVPGMANAAGGSSLLGGGGGMSGIFNQLANPILSSAGLFGSASSYASVLGLSSSAAGSQAAMLAAQTGEFGLAGLAGTASSAGAGAMSGLLTAAPYVGAALLAFSALRKNKTPAVFSGMSATGNVSRDSLNLGMTAYANNGQYSWAHEDSMVAPWVSEYLKPVFADLEAAAKALGRDSSALSSSVGFNISFAGQGTPEEKARQIVEQLGSVSDAFAQKLIPNLAQFAQANETATQTLLRMVQTQEQLKAAELQMTDQLAGAARALPGQLGITGLQGAQAALSVSEYQSPTSRLGAARSLLNAGYGKAMGGDLEAVNAFPQLLQQALSIGRETGASGPAFQALFTEGNRQLNDLLSRQQTIQNEILRDLPVSVMEASRDQITAIRMQTKLIVDALNETNTSLRRLAEQS